MKLIAIDSSGLTASVAVLTEEELIAEYTVQHQKTHSRTLLPMLDEICRMTEQDLTDIDAVAVACGPGSFTGLRIGSATAKGIGLALQKPLIEVPTLMALAYALPGAQDAVICPIMDARRGQVYNGLYRFAGGRLETLADQRALSIDELCAELNDRFAGMPGCGDGGDSDPDKAACTVIFLGDGVPVCRGQIEEKLKTPHLFAPVHVSRQRAAAVGACAFEMLKRGVKPVPAETHVPVYLRKSQAEREREAKKVTFSIREMTAEDIPEVCRIEENCFTGEAWTESALYTYLLREDALLIVAEESAPDGGTKTIAGYAGLLMVPEEADLISIAVLPTHRREGAATLLLHALRDMGREKGVSVIHLEVRSGNAAALAFYEKEGFTVDGVRKNYYRDPVEDAVNMTWRAEAGQKQKSEQEFS